MSNYSSSEGKQKNKQQNSSGINTSSSSFSYNSGSFIDNSFFDKMIILNSTVEGQKQNNSIFNKAKVQKIKANQNFLQIFTTPTKNNNIKIKKNEYDENVERKKLQGRVEYFDNKLTRDYPCFRASILSNFMEVNHKHYQEWLKQLQHRNFISMFLPLGQKSSCIKSITISNKTLTILGYSPEEAALELNQFKTNSMSLLDHESYCTIFWIYTNTMCKLMSAELNGTPTIQETLMESQQIITNEMVGKNQRRVKVEMKVYMPSAFIISMQILSVAKGDKMYDPYLELNRKQIQQMQYIKNKQQLGHVLKFQKQSKQKQGTRCSYIVIDNYLE